MFDKFFNWLADKITGPVTVDVPRLSPTPPEVHQLNRLTEAQYAAFEKQAHASTIVNQTTTELLAGYQLGMQHALKVLREGWVVR